MGPMSRRALRRLRGNSAARNPSGPKPCGSTSVRTMTRKKGQNGNRVAGALGAQGRRASESTTGSS